jgi:hypothetical protein
MRSARKKSSRLPAIRLVESPHPRENPVAYRSAASLLRRLRPGNKGPPLLRRRDRALAAWGRWIRWMRWEGVARRPPPVLTRARANTRANVTEAGLWIRAQVQTAGRLARASPPPGPLHQSNGSAASSGPRLLERILPRSSSSTFL